MGMLALESKARHHWKTWLPKRTAELKAEGMWEIALRNAAVNAQDRIMELRRSGYQQWEAEEVALSEFILLAPEESEEVDEEEAELDRLFHEGNREVAEAIRQYDLTHPD